MLGKDGDVVSIVVEIHCGFLSLRGDLHRTRNGMGIFHCTEGCLLLLLLLLGSHERLPRSVKIRLCESDPSLVSKRIMASELEGDVIIVS